MRGSVIKRGTTYSVVLDLGRGPDGKRVRRWHSGYRTKKDAERARTELLARIDQGSYVEPSRLTVAVFLRDQWLPGLAGQVRPTTLHSYRTNLERYVLPRVGYVTLQRLTPAHLNSLYGALLAAGGKDGRPLSARTAQAVHMTVRKALGDAARWGCWPATSPPSRPHRSPAAWTCGPGRRPSCGRSCSTSRTTGWPSCGCSRPRRGCAAASCSGCAGRTSTSTSPASLSGRRSCSPAARSSPASPRRAAAGDRSRSTPAPSRRCGVAGGAGGRAARVGRRLGGLGPGVHPRGRDADPSRVAIGRLRVAGRRAGLPPIRLHDLRHTHASLGLAAGVPVKVMSERLGHTSSSFTADAYQHVTPALEEQAAATVARLVFGP